MDSEFSGEWALGVVVQIFKLHLLPSCEAS